MRIWHDDWLLNQHELKVWTHPKTLPLEAKVNSLIDPNTRSWQNNMIDQIFLLFEAQEIKVIPLSFRKLDDRMIWHFSQDG